VVTVAYNGQPAGDKDVLASARPLD